jgi:hypothetical protein
MECKEKPAVCSIPEKHENSPDVNDEPQIPGVDSTSSFRPEKTQRMLKVSKPSSDSCSYVMDCSLESANSTHCDWR